MVTGSKNRIRAKTTAPEYAHRIDLGAPSLARSRSWYYAPSHDGEMPPLYLHGRTSPILLDTFFPIFRMHSCSLTTGGAAMTILSPLHRSHHHGYTPPCLLSPHPNRLHYVAWNRFGWRARPPQNLTNCTPGMTFLPSHPANSNAPNSSTNSPNTPFPSACHRRTGSSRHPFSPHTQPPCP